MNPVRLKLVCHASTSAIRAAAFPTDEPLDMRGRRKLGASGRIPSADRVLAGPELRTRQTAEAFGTEATIVANLRDCDYGRWSGRPYAEVQAEEPDAVAEWLRDPQAVPHGGESLTALVGRVAGWLEAQAASPGRTVAFTHPSIIRAAVVCALLADVRCFWRIDIAPLSTVALNGNGARWTLAALGLKFP